MSPRPDALSLIQASFPGRDRLIQRAYRGDRTFREICDDYLKCVVTLERLKQRQENQPMPRWQEYTELLENLGGEIQAWLEAMETGSYRMRDRPP